MSWQIGVDVVDNDAAMGCALYIHNTWCRNSDVCLCVYKTAHVFLFSPIPFCLLHTTLVQNSGKNSIFMHALLIIYLIIA